MKNCPHCDIPVDGLRCPQCGHAEAGASTADPDRYRCVDVDRGLRCTRLGTVSLSTLGGGPFYCTDHIPGLARARNGGTAPDGTFAHLRALTKRITPVPKPLDLEAVAERLAIQQEAP